MARTPQAPQRANLSPEQLQRGIERLRRVIDAINAFDPKAMIEKYPAGLSALEERIREAVEKTFGPGTTQYHRFISAGDIGYSAPLIMGGPPTPLQDYQNGAESNKKDSIALLTEAIRSLEEDVADAGPAPAPAAGSKTFATHLSRDVFVVHGHDEGARESVARYLEKLGFKAIVLHEQANQGRTIIEKVEAHSEVGFAVVLLTPDDVGGKPDGEMKPRARQNVVLELGYFVGKLGRKHVCALKRGSVEVPSDFDGVVYLPFEEGSDWRRSLAQELQAAGHKIDWNIVMSG